MFKPSFLKLALVFVAVLVVAGVIYALLSTSEDETQLDQPVTKDKQPLGTPPLVSSGPESTPPTPFSKEPPIIPGSEMLIDVVDGAASPITDVTFVISIQYDPPLDVNNFSYTVFMEGAPPYRIPITVPGSRSRTVITATKEGFLETTGLVIESAFYHDRINPFREGGVSEILLEHTFIMKPVKASE